MVTWKEPPGIFQNTFPGPGRSSQHPQVTVAVIPTLCRETTEALLRRIQSIVIKFHRCSLPPTEPISLPSWPQGKEPAAAGEKCCRWMVCHGHSWTDLAHRCQSRACQLPSSPQIFVAKGLKGRGVSLLTWSTVREGAVLGELVEGSKHFPPGSSGPDYSAREGMESLRAGHGGCCLANQVSAGSPTGTAELA